MDSEWPNMNKKSKVSTDRYHGILQEHCEVSNNEMLQERYDNKKQKKRSNHESSQIFEIMTTRLEILRLTYRGQLGEMR